MEPLGRISGLFRYPVKSMAGEPLAEAALGWHGMEGDRRFAFVQDDDASDFPWLTIRQVPAMTTYRPISAAGPESGPPVVHTPAGRELPVTAPELTQELGAALGGPVSLLRSERGLFDVFTISMLSLQTVAGLSELSGSTLAPERFRPTLLVDAPDHTFPEDAWVGRELSLGSEPDAPLIRLDVRDARCSVINFDHATAERNPAVLRAAAQQRDGCVGVYGTVVRPGVVRVGDELLAAD